MTGGERAAGAERTSSAPLEVVVGGTRLVLDLDDDRPAALRELRVGDGESVLRPHPLVEVFTAAERHDRMTLGYVGSTVGARLRVEEARQHRSVVEIVQSDVTVGLRVETRLEVGEGGFRVSHEVVNAGAEEIVLFALPSLSIRTAAEPSELVLVHGRSEWLGEGRWVESPMIELLPELGFEGVAQPDRTGFGQTSAGGWPTGSVLPVGALASRSGAAIAWQIESSAGWHWSLSRGDGGVILSAGGPTEREHSGEVRLAPGDRFVTVSAGCVASPAGRDGVFAALTEHRRSIRKMRPADERLPIVYNDYMNTLMGQPTTEALRPLIAAAAAVGAEYFCIDAGWFSDTSDYWSEVGAWEDAPTRFSDGLAAVIDEIRASGMTPGLWIEPESVGLDSPVIGALPDEAFFQRYGSPVVEQRRRHLDLRHPAARAHLDAVVDRLVREHGIGFLKLDYNIEPGSGTDVGGLAPGHGLLEHTRALRDWLVAIGHRHPHLLVENCASGGMRSDYHLLAVTHVQSTSDQQDAARYAPIAAAAPALILPEQAGNWAYPAREMSEGELAITLVSGLSGRFTLSGFLNRLSPAQFTAVADAVTLAKSMRVHLATAVPFWPRGMPGFDDEIVVLGYLLHDDTRLLFVWSRGGGGSVEMPPDTQVTQLFPTGRTWARAGDGSGAVIVPPGPDAAVFRTIPHTAV